MTALVLTICGLALLLILTVARNIHLTNDRAKLLDDLADALEEVDELRAGALNAEPIYDELAARRWQAELDAMLGGGA